MNTMLSRLSKRFTKLSKLLLSVVVLLTLSVAATAAPNYTKITYIHPDGLGNPAAASDEQGNLEWRIEYYPFGAEYSNSEVRREADISFAGKAYDEDIGLSYFGGRWYHPQLGIFTGIDPMPVNAEDWRTFNRYSYGFNNPYRYLDPDGNLPFLVPVAIFLAKEIAAEGASRATGGATDFLSFRRVSTKAVHFGIRAAKNNTTKKVDINQTGSYTNTHASGKTYVGKGSRKRSQISGRREANRNNDPHVATDWTAAKNTREAFKQESRRLDAQGGPKSPTNYNRIEQPGKKYRKQDGEL